MLKDAPGKKARVRTRCANGRASMQRWCRAYKHVDYAAELADMAAATRNLPLAGYFEAATRHRFCLNAPGDFVSTPKVGSVAPRLSSSASMSAAHALSSFLPSSSIVSSIVLSSSPSSPLGSQSSPPVSQDGMGNDLGVSSSTLFINGGGGSVFSRAALQKMDTERCVNNTMPGQPWWRWQSDWMIGACAADAGITPLRQPQGRFNQFACTEDSVQFCEGVEVAEYYWPSTMHPVRLEAQMRHLYHYYENPTTRPVPRVRMRRVNSNNDVMMAQGGSPSDNYVAASGLELSQ